MVVGEVWWQRPFDIGAWVKHGARGGSIANGAKACLPSQTGQLDHLLKTTTPNSRAASSAINRRAHTTSFISQPSEIHSLDVDLPSMLDFIASRHLHQVGRRPEGGPSP